MSAWLAVAVGGALGSLARYGLGLWAKTAVPNFPVATLAVNVLGGFVMGALGAYTLARPEFPLWLRAGLMTGVLGGFTTFSAFSLETLNLWREGATFAATANILLNVGLSLVACALGAVAARSLA